MTRREESVILVDLRQRTSRTVKSLRVSKHRPFELYREVDSQTWRSLESGQVIVRNQSTVERYLQGMWRNGWRVILGDNPTIEPVCYAIMEGGLTYYTTGSGRVNSTYSDNLFAPTQKGARKKLIKDIDGDVTHYREQLAKSLDKLSRAFAIPEKGGMPAPQEGAEQEGTLPKKRRRKA